MTNTLVVYYSLSGNTKDIAEMIAAEFDAYVEPIHDSIKRTGGLGHLKSCWEVLTKKHGAIKKPEKHPDRFDLVIVGSPTWVGTMSSPIRTYLDNHPINSSRIAVFSTSGGPKNEKTLKDMAELAGKDPDAMLGLSKAEIESGAHKDKIGDFVTALKTRLSG